MIKTIDIIPTKMITTSDLSVIYILTRKLKRFSLINGMDTMFATRFLLATTILNVVLCQERAFSVDQISCIASHHDLSKHYDACKIFRSKLNEKGNVVMCKIAYDADNKMISGCAPAFGTSDDAVKVDYVVSYNKKLNTWEITANVLLWQVYHPLYVCLIVCIFVVFACMSSSQQSDSFDGALVGAFVGSSLLKNDMPDTISFNVVAKGD